MENQPLDYDEPLPLNQFYFNKPSLILRIKSMLIDAVVIIVLMLVAAWLLNALSIASGVVRGAVFVAIFLYEPLTMAFGRTLGQKMVGLQVQRKGDVVANTLQRRSISLFASVARYIVKGLLGWISLLTIHSDPYGQAIHDKVAGSVMCFAK